MYVYYKWYLISNIYIIYNVLWCLITGRYIQSNFVQPMKWQTKHIPAVPVEWRPPFPVCKPFASSPTPVPEGLGPVTMGHHGSRWLMVGLWIWNFGWGFWMIYDDFKGFYKCWAQRWEFFDASRLKILKILKHVTRLFHPNPFASTRSLQHAVECGQNRLNVQWLRIGKLQRIHLRSSELHNRNLGTLRGKVIKMKPLRHPHLVVGHSQARECPAANSSLGGSKRLPPLIWAFILHKWPWFIHGFFEWNDAQKWRTIHFSS